MKEWLSGQVKGSCNKYRGLVSRGVASNDCNRTVAIGSRVSVERSVKYMEYDSITLGQRIKQIRLERGETMEEFGQSIRKRSNKDLISNKSNVSRWERGKNVPNDFTLESIAKLGNTTVDELLHGKPSGMTTALEIMDYYIEHYTKLEHNDTVRKLKEIRVDMENAEQFGRSG